MFKRTAIGVAAAILAAGAVVSTEPAQAAAPPGPAAGGSARPTSIQGIAALPGAEQAKLLMPLRDLAGGLDGIGRSGRADIYSGVALDPVNGTVKLYVTNVGQARKLIDAAKAAQPQIDTSLVRIQPQSKYTRAELHAARDRVEASLSALPVTVDSASVPVDGSGLVLGIEAKPAQAQAVRADGSADAAAGAALAAAAAVEIRTTAGHHLETSSRWADSAPYYAGGYLFGVGGCTAGIPVKDGSGHNYLITASHCGRNGVVYRNGNGSVIGGAVRTATQWDAVLIDAPSAAWEFDGPQDTFRKFQLVGTRYSYEGDLVCQDGYVDGVICGIEVDDEDVKNFTVQDGNYGEFTARGVIGHQVNGGCANNHGDSGGLVFGLNDASTRHVRGIVSALVDGMGCNGIFWTEAPDIYSTFGVHLTDRLY
ncbi:hypothetical protein ACGFZP_39090 [Kitasatospora sp. NPDC048239]|uniref:hypothetical protein n=1 Tax=Kitasatospora sp. NPDC048239 TaxID=3364046 RepID=UPI003719291C